MQVIQCKYHGPSETRGSRIAAKCEAGSISIPYPHELSGQACYRLAAEKLADKLGWTGKHYGPLLGGQLSDSSYVFIFDNSHARN
jgi:hypothetical protein